MYKASPVYITQKKRSFSLQGVSLRRPCSLALPMLPHVLTCLIRRSRPSRILSARRRPPGRRGWWAVGVVAEVTCGVALWGRRFRKALWGGARGAALWGGTVGRRGAGVRPMTLRAKAEV